MLFYQLLGFHSGRLEKYCEAKFCIHVFPSDQHGQHNSSLHFNEPALCNLGTSPNNFGRSEKAFQDNKKKES
jgi:hypothetical protein